MKIKTGTTVTWRSKAYEDPKTGEVVAFVPAGVAPNEAYPAIDNLPPSRCKFGYGPTGASKNDRYIVKVRNFHKRLGAELHPDFYSPAAKTVEDQN